MRRVAFDLDVESRWKGGMILGRIDVDRNASATLRTMDE